MPVMEREPRPRRFTRRAFLVFAVSAVAAIALEGPKVLGEGDKKPEFSCSGDGPVCPLPNNDTLPGNLQLAAPVK